MANSVTHPFVSGKPDGADTTLVRASNWNANHTISIDTVKAVTSAPGSPANLDTWWEVTGTSPSEVWTQKGVNSSGTVRVLQTVTF